MPASSGPPGLLLSSGTAAEATMLVQSRILRSLRGDIAAVVFLSLGVAVFEDWKEVSGGHNCLCAVQHPVSAVSCCVVACSAASPCSCQGCMLGSLPACPCASTEDDRVRTSPWLQHHPSPTAGWAPVMLEASDPFQLTGFALSLLLAFRLNASYTRWVEARTAWSSVTSNCRELMRQVGCALPAWDVWVPASACHSRGDSLRVLGTSCLKHIQCGGGGVFTCLGMCCLPFGHQRQEAAVVFLCVETRAAPAHTSGTLRLAALERGCSGRLSHLLVSLQCLSDLSCREDTALLL